MSDFLDFVPDQNRSQDQTLPHFFVSQHSKQSHRKDSQESIQTKATDNSDSSHLDLNWCHHLPLQGRNQCMHCGVYFGEERLNEGLKTQRYYGSSWSIASLRELASQFVTKNVEPLNVNSRDAVERASEEFGFSLQTQCLAVYIYYTAFEGKNQFHEVVMSLFLSAKLMEHTDRHTLRRYRKFFKKCFSFSDYVMLERYILQKMSFNILVPTFADFVLVYLHRGICDSTEAVDVACVEDSLLSKVQDRMFSGAFMKFPPETLASNLLNNARQEATSEESWSHHIQAITELQLPHAIEWEVVTIERL